MIGNGMKAKYFMYPIPTNTPASYAVMYSCEA